MDSRSTDQIFESELASALEGGDEVAVDQRPPRTAKEIQEELERRKKQLLDLCRAVKADSVSDLQEILCCMVLSESVYKRPAAEVVRAVNKFKADFGGQLVSLEHVQPSSDHVLHRYLLAEAGDTLFASFIGTKQYKDVMADANIFQGAIFHEDAMADLNGIEDAEPNSEMNNREDVSNSMETKPKQTKFTHKPAVHRGFMARAKGIPALELYRLAQRKRQKLVLCGHSLGGAVAVLATLAILRVIAVSSKETERVQVKCITFSQPPVGNAALRDYVNGKGWQQFFKTYCIPEDLVPRILSPAYFHHYNAQNPLSSSDVETSPSKPKSRENLEKQKAERVKEHEGEELVLGLGPVQTSFWRLSRLVPIEGVRRQLNKYRGRKVDAVERSVLTGSDVSSSIDEIVTPPQSLEIEESSDGISLRPFPEKNEVSSDGVNNGKSPGKNSSNGGDKRAWGSMPSLPSYIPFGQLYLLGNSSVESLSSSEYSKLTSVRSVIAEVRERFQSHSMRSYRSRFQRCSTTVESFPSPPEYSLHHELQPEMQNIRIRVGAPLKRPPKQQLLGDGLIRVFPSIDPTHVDLKLNQNMSVEMEEKLIHPDGLSDFVVFCTTDFSTVVKEVHVRTRKVRLIGLEGAGKTSLLKSILDQGRTTNNTSLETFNTDVVVREGVAGGLLYSDSAGLNLQNLNMEASRFRDELWKGIRDLSKKIDLVVLVHNLSHRVPRYGSSAAQPPALSVLLDEAKSLGVPWVLAITNKFSVSAHQQKEAINTVVQAYQASPSTTVVINSCPYVMPSALGTSLSWNAIDSDATDLKSGNEKIKFAPLNLVRRPFQKKPAVLHVEGVMALCQIVHQVLHTKEEADFQELARDRIFLEFARERGVSGTADRDALAKSNSLSAAAVGASVGAGVGIILAVVMGAASALRKP
ncbi:hypothetical protein F511_04792 [Dorcoceras hygrometricum]|uniref:Fungal lipase-type domain-containing protein n=1 Tax=Dorcoceras hygrometricum TaxID=472368 RepID=A0A2Z7AUZ8_9LAMI|nr:hypothetical protein F511_04792 [Dorcoceras hygrometricum]